jgi:hypothetical protein
VSYRFILPWREVRARHRGQSEAELLSVIRDCYRRDEGVRKLLTLRLMDEGEEALAVVEDLRRLVGEAFWAKDRRGEPLGPDLRAARAHLRDIEGLVDDPQVLLECLLDFAGHGIGFTVKYGDMWEGYYDDIGAVFDRAMRHLVEHRGVVDVEASLERAAAMVARTESMGWGFYEYLEVRLEETRKDLGLAEDG